MADPDPRTAGSGVARIAQSGAEVITAGWSAEALSLSGHVARTRLGRPHLTLKLALSLDGCIATAEGESRWITGAVARAHAHRERARADAILVGGGTLRADAPQLDVRLPGLEHRHPLRCVLSRGDAPVGWQAIGSPDAIDALENVRYLFVEGGAGAAAALLAADMVDRLLIYRAPIVIGAGLPGLNDIGLTDLASTHHRWALDDTRQLGHDRLEIFTRTR